MERAFARLSIALVALVVATGVATGAVSAADPDSGPIRADLEVRADLEGRPIVVSEIPVTYVGDAWNDQFSSVYPW